MNISIYYSSALFHNVFSVFSDSDFGDDAFHNG